MLPAITSATLAGLAISVLMTFVVISFVGIKRIRRFVIKFAEFCTVLLLTGAAVAGAIIGFGIGRISGPALFPPTASVPDNVQIAANLFGLIGGAAGAFVFLASASVPLALIFLLSEIAVNTRTN